VKVRSGFVSNSSSSSFIVAFPKRPESVEEVQEFVFKKDDFFHNPYYEYRSFDHNIEMWPTSEIAEIIWKDICQQSPMTDAEVAERTNTGWFEGYPEAYEEWIHSNWEYWKALPPEEQRAYYDRKYAHVKEIAEDVASRFITMARGVLGDSCCFYEFEYSDNDGELYSSMEHGGLFERMLHLTINKH
jgi:hypothetical protein